MQRIDECNSAMQRINSDPELTSILTKLETGNLNATFNPEALGFDEIAHKIDEFIVWLNQHVQGIVLTAPEGNNQCTLSILNLDTVVSHFRRQIKRKQKLHNDRYYVCAKCDAKIYTQPNVSTWDLLQSHEHIEERLVAALEFDETECAGSSELSTTETSLSTPVGSLIEEPTETDFKFNFAPQYDKGIEDLVYLPQIERTDEFSDLTIQCRNTDRLFCLLCVCPLSSGNHSVKIHVNGSKHLKLLKDKEVCDALHMYHFNFTKLEAVVQAHQVYFDPKSNTKCYCNICKFDVLYANLCEHVTEATHMEKVCELVKQKSLLVNSLLLARQMQLYTKNSRVDGNLTPVANETQSQKNTKVPEKKQKVLHQVVKSVSDGTNGTLGLLERRFAEHLLHLEERSNLIRCKSCDVPVGNDISGVKAHILSENHKLKTKLNIRKYRYCCYVCFFKAKQDVPWDNHFKQGQHTKALSALPVENQNDYNEYECLTCRTIFYGTEAIKNEHVTKQGQVKKVKEVKLPPDVVKLFQSESLINAEAMKLVNEANIVVASLNSVWACCYALERHLASQYPHCKAYPFGSRVTGLGSKYSDLDVFVDIGDMYTGHLNQDPLSQEKIVKSVTKLLKKDTTGSFSDVVPIPKARTPIIQVYHRPTNLDCDLSFRHGLSVENTKFLKLCMGIQPLMQPLILILKKWSKCCKFDEYLTTYALSMMTIFFMQVNGYLMSVKTLREFNPGNSLVIDGWDTINYKNNIDVLKQHLLKVLLPPLCDLLRNFFLYYSNFNYETDVICPLLGHIIPKSAFQGDKIDRQLPPEMQSYIIKVMKTPDTEHFRAYSTMCIQDPFDLSHNLTKACPRSFVERFKTMCRLSWNALQY